MKKYPIRLLGGRRTVAMAVAFVSAGSLLTGPAFAASSSPSAPAPTSVASPTAVPAPADSLPRGGAPADGSGAAQNLTFGIRPFLPEGAKPRGAFLFRAEPGQTVHDEVSVFNYADVPLSVEVYATDATTSSGGGFGLLERRVPPKGVGTWVTMKVPTTGGIRIQPHVRVDIPFTVTVPDSASPGDHLGGIVISLPAKTRDASGNTVRVDSRVSSMLSMRVGGEIRPGLAVTGLTGRYTPQWQPWAAGSADLSFDVRNQGNIAQGASYVVSLHGMFGITRTLPAVDVRGILPGDSVHVDVPVPDVWPAGRYKATVEVRGLATAGDPVAPPVSASTHFWAIPWPQLLVVLGLGLLIALIVTWRRWRRRRRLRAAAPATTPGPVLEGAGVA